MTLKGKTALITGAGRGIGRAIALTFASAGCNVAVTARTQEEIDGTALAAADHGVKSLAVSGDVGNPNDITRVVETTLEKHGAIDILVNNAGLAAFKPVWELSLDEWRNAFDVNLTGAFLYIQAVLPGMMARRQGRIINISSVTGLKALPGQSAYGAAKHALNGLTKSLNLELREYGIAAHVICPGAVDTRLSREAMPHRDPSDWMTPDDVAQAAMYLASLGPRVAVDMLQLRRFSGEPLA